MTAWVTRRTSGAAPSGLTTYHQHRPTPSPSRHASRLPAGTRPNGQQRTESQRSPSSSRPLSPPLHNLGQRAALALGRHLPSPSLASSPPSLPPTFCQARASSLQLHPAKANSLLPPSDARSSGQLRSVQAADLPATPASSRSARAGRLSRRKRGRSGERTPSELDRTTGCFAELCLGSCRPTTTTSIALRRTLAR